MKTIAIIPAKGHSNRLKNKNRYMLLGKPLISYTIEQAKKSKFIDEIYVSTEDKHIKKISLDLGVKVIDRPQELVEDNFDNDFFGKQRVAEHALKILQDKIECVCLLQANSPQITVEKIDEAIAKLFDPNKRVWQCISINEQTLFTDGAIRVFKRRCIEDIGLDMYLSVVFTDYVDVHTIEDIYELEEIMKNESNNL